MVVVSNQLSNPSLEASVGALKARPRWAASTWVASLAAEWAPSPSPPMAVKSVWLPVTELRSSISLQASDVFQECSISRLGGLTNCHVTPSNLRDPQEQICFSGTNQDFRHPKTVTPIVALGHMGGSWRPVVVASGL